MSTGCLSWMSDVDAVAAARPQGQRPCSERFCMTDRSARPGSVVVTVCGEVDLVSGPLLRTGLEAHVRQAGPDLVVDLGRVRFLGVAGLIALLATWTATVAAGVRFCVVARTPTVLRPLQVIGLDTMFDVVDESAAGRHR